MVAVYFYGEETCVREVEAQQRVMEMPIQLGEVQAKAYGAHVLYEYAPRSRLAVGSETADP